MSALRNLVSKEIKELFRDPKILIGMILVSIIIFPLLSKLVTYSVKSSTSLGRHFTIGLVDEDQTPLSRSLREYLTAIKNVDVIMYASTSQIGNLTQEVTAIIIIPKGFQANITSGLRAHIKVYTTFKPSSIFSQGSKGTFLTSLLKAYERYLSVFLLHNVAPNVNPSTILEPFNIKEGIFIKGKLIDIHPYAISQLLINYYFILPYSLLLLLLVSISISATAMAYEKERKTLETLLTLPISRVTIFLGKLIGSIIVALISSGAYVLGFTYYIRSIMNAVQAPISAGISRELLLKLGLLPTKLSYVLLSIVILMALISAISLALSLGAFAESVQSAQSISGILLPFIMIPWFLATFVDPSSLSLPVRLLLYAIPFTHVAIATRAAMENNYLVLSIAALYLAIFTAIILYLTARFFSIEEKVLSSRLFKRWRRKS